VSPLAPTYEPSVPYAPRRAFDAALGSALAASIAIHVTTLAVLLVTGSGAGGGTLALQNGAERPVEVMLATARTSASARTASEVLAALAAESLPVPPKESPPAPSALSPPAAATAARSAPAHTGGSRRPRVTIDDRVPRARFAEALEGGPLADFPLEVETPVGLPGKLDVPYPPSALDAQREGTVLAWAIVDAQGRVEDVHVVEGPPDFAAAVTSALRLARLIPARNDGSPIRFYVTLAFDFRLEARGDATTASAGR
jgi:TonB family protein